MKRVGIVDWDTSHVVQFTMRLNHVGELAEDQYIDSDYRVVAGVPGTSEITAPDRLAEYHDKLTGWGVEVVDSVEQLVDMVDVVCVESQSGYVHLDRARPFIEAGIPTYIDKPFVINVEDGLKIKELAAKHGVPIFSSSSLRYAPEVVEAQHDAEGVGSVVGAFAYSPASLHDKNPGLAHYGIHGVETLYALMGPGCVELSCISEEGGEVSTGRWADGRVASIRGTRAGKHAYGYTVWGDKGVRSEYISTTYIYRELLKKIVQMWETGTPDLELDETIEIAAFIAAAWESANNGGNVTKLEFTMGQ